MSKQFPKHSHSHRRNMGHAHHRRNSSGNNGSIVDRSFDVPDNFTQISDEVSSMADSAVSAVGRIVPPAENHLLDVALARGGGGGAGGARDDAMSGSSSGGGGSSQGGSTSLHLGAGGGVGRAPPAASDVSVGAEDVGVEVGADDFDYDPTRAGDRRARVWGCGRACFPRWISSAPTSIKLLILLSAALFVGAAVLVGVAAGGGRLEGGDQGGGARQGGAPSDGVSGGGASAGETDGGGGQGVVATGPSNAPTAAPTANPTSAPTAEPSPLPTAEPTPLPTADGTDSTAEGDGASDAPPGSSATTFYVTGGRFRAGPDRVSLPANIRSLPSPSGDERLFHLGNFNRPASTGCDPKFYGNFNSIWSESSVPVYALPGGKDWNDCPDPFAAWENWIEYMYAYDEQHWDVPDTDDDTYRVERQAGREENFAFVSKGVLFVGLHLVTGYIPDSSDWSERLADNVDWVRTNVESNLGEDGGSGGVEVVVVLGNSPVEDEDNADFFTPFAEDVATWGKPVIYIHETSDVWSWDQDLFGIPNFLRVQVQGRIWPPLRVVIDTKANTFNFDQEGWLDDTSSIDLAQGRAGGGM